MSVFDIFFFSFGANDTVVLLVEIKLLLVWFSSGFKVSYMSQLVHQTPFSFNKNNLVKRKQFFLFYINN